MPGSEQAQVVEFTRERPAGIGRPRLMWDTGAPAAASLTGCQVADMWAAASDPRGWHRLCASSPADGKPGGDSALHGRTCARRARGLDCAGDSRSTEPGLCAAAAGIDPDKLRTARELKAAYPFDSFRKRMTLVRGADAETVAYVKGAPRETLALCDQIRWGDRTVALTDETRRKVLADHDRLAGDGLRLLAVASRPVGRELAGAPQGTVERDLIFLGLIALWDPPRAEVAEAIAYRRATTDDVRRDRRRTGRKRVCVPDRSPVGVQRRLDGKPDGVRRRGGRGRHPARLDSATTASARLRPGASLVLGVGDLTAVRADDPASRRGSEGLAPSAQIGRERPSVARSPQRAANAGCPKRSPTLGFRLRRTVSHLATTLQTPCARRKT